MAFPENYGYAIPFVPHASNTEQQGFVRIVNQSEDAGDVRITPFDDTGRRFPVIEIHLDPWASVHFNSSDLEDGNAAKGLSRGTGDGSGDWRLELEADFLFEALAYIRTPDGFVTSVFEAANWWDVDVYWVPFFNPGSNPNQVSGLRIVNPGAEDAEATITGIDDTGASPGSAVTVTVPAGNSRTVWAAELESGGEGLTGALGDGAGKWRLSVTAEQPLVVMSLLSSPTGHLTNLSTAPTSGVPIATEDNGSP